MNPAGEPSLAAAAGRKASTGRRRWSLRTQLIAWNIVALALLLGVLGLVIRYTVSSFLMASVNRELERLTQFGPPRPPLGRPGFFRANGPPDGPPPPGMKEPFKGLPPGRRPRRGPRPPRGDDNFRPIHFDLQGHPFMPGETRKAWDKAALAEAQQGRERRARIVVNGEPLQVLSTPYVYKGKIVGAAQAAYPLTDVERALAGLDAALLTLIPVGLLGAGAGGAYLTDRVLRRVRRTTQAAERLSVEGANDFSARLPVIGNDEFSELSETFNGLLGRLEGAFRQQERLLEQQRRFTADASHELKTPLTVIKGTASMALSSGSTGDGDDPGHRPNASYQRSLRDIDRAADAMSHLVGDLLLLARSDGGQLGKNPITLPVRELLQQAIASVPRPGNGGESVITLDANDSALCVRGNEAELVRLFSNLLDNAVRHTPPPQQQQRPGAICVSARAEGESVRVSVRDTGAGIAPEHLPHLGERFYRVDASRARPDGGTGLGLSICKSIVDAHHGTLRIESVVGAGTTVTVSLPRAG